MNEKNLKIEMDATPAALSVAAVCSAFSVSAADLSFLSRKIIHDS